MSPHAIQRPSREPSRRGAVVVLFAFLLVLLMFSLTMAIDVGYMYVVQAELQAAADSAALAAAGEMSGAPTSVYTENATSAAKLYAGEHGSLGMSSPLEVDDQDIEFGDATFDQSTGRWTFEVSPSSTAPYAVRVTVRRDGDKNPNVARFFSGILGADVGTQSASATAMVAPRDIALVVDLSKSMTYDSMLIHRNQTQINLRDVWVTLAGPANSPSTKTVGDQTFVTNYQLKTPDQSIYASEQGDTFGSMSKWGTLIYQGTYNQSAVRSDPGMYYLPQRNYDPNYWGWFISLGYPSAPQYTWLVDDLSNPMSLRSRGYSNARITSLLRRPVYYESSTTYRNRVKVLLGLATWNDDGDNFFENHEVTTSYEPYVAGVGWDSWIEDVRNGTGATYYSSVGGASYFRHRYGLKSYVNWLMDRQFAKSAPVPGSSGYTPALQRSVAQPLQALKDAVLDFSDYLQEVESNDKVGLVIYGTHGAVDPYSETNGLTNDHAIIGDLPYPHQAGEHGPFTNTGEALLRGYRMIFGPGSRTHAHKVIVFMRDGNTTAYNGFDVIDDLDSPGNVTALNDIENLEDFDQLFGGIPSGSIATGGTENATRGREETLAIGRILVSNHLGMGDSELNVVGVGAGADMENMLQPLAEASGGEAYHAEPDPNDPSVLPETLKQIYRRIGGRRPVALISQSPSP